MSIHVTACRQRRDVAGGGVREVEHGLRGDGQMLPCTLDLAPLLQENDSVLGVASNNIAAALGLQLGLLLPATHDPNDHALPQVPRFADVVHSLAHHVMLHARDALGLLLRLRSSSCSNVHPRQHILDTTANHTP